MRKKLKMHENWANPCPLGAYILRGDKVKHDRACDQRTKYETNR